MGGGYPEGRTILLSGRCGTGKTIMCFHFIQESVKHNEKCVFITFEQSKAKVTEDALAVGIDLDYMEEKGSLKIVGGMIAHVKYFKEKTRATADDLINEIKEIIQEVGATRVVVDSINLFSLLFDTLGDKRVALAGLVYTLEQLGCTSLLTSEIPEGTRKLGSHGFEDFVVDGVINLDRVYFGSSYERVINIVKMRGAKHSQSLRSYIIDRRGMTVYPDHEPRYVKLASDAAVID